MTGLTKILHGDVIESLRGAADNSFDACLCDPPYGLFMSKKWDYDVPSTELWSEVFRVLKPGAPLIAFGGTRTYHRMVVRIEDAGFEIRDCLAWMYGSGFPKSLNVSKAIDAAAGADRPVIGSRILTGSAAMSTAEKGGTYASNTSSAGRSKTVDVTGPATDLSKQWDGYGTALKPAFEPAVLARKPLDGTVANNVANWGCGALAIDACRIGRAEGDTSGWAVTGAKASDNVAMSGANYDRDPKPDASGRWPANVMLDEGAAAAMDAQSGNRPGMSGGGVHKKGYQGGMFGGIDGNPSHARNDQGGASRFYYCAKVSKAEREAGCEALGDSDGKGRNPHPTLKPLALTRWLASLIKPPTGDATLLVPFSGAGSEMIGAMQAGWPSVVGIERDAEYVAIAEDRIAHWGVE